MDTIKEYILNIFSTLPQTAKIENLKQELLANMEDKYEELKELGKSESESISIVISEFGDIDELLLELNLKKETKETQLEKFTISNYFNESRKSFKKIGYGILLTLLGVSVAYLFYELIKFNFIFSTLSNNALYLIPIVCLLIFILPSIYIFISEGLNINKLNQIKNNNYKLSEDAKKLLNTEYELFKPKFAKGITLGIILVFCSLISLIILKTNIGIKNSITACIFLVLIAIAIITFINVGTYYSDLQFFITTREYILKNKDIDRVLGAVAAFIFPITALICLFTIIFYKNWFLPIAIFSSVSIIYGAFAGAYFTMKNR